MIFDRGFFDNEVINESVIRKSLEDIRNFDSDYEYSRQKTIFLSHKHDDLKDLRGVMGLLQKFDIKVYIDSMDNKMPNETSSQTAHRIKEVIKFCDKFILLATDKAIESYWCNWELGFGDTQKYIDHIAVLPMKEKGSYEHRYKGNEYLQIYPSIDFEDGTNKYRNGNLIPQDYYVSYPPNSDNVRTITSIQNWLNK